MKSINARYSLLQGGYWFADCATFPFLVLLYKAYGFDEVTIGIISSGITAFNMLSQLSLGIICDKLQTVKKVIIPMMLFGCAVSLLLPMGDRRPFFTGVVVILMNLSIPALKDVIDGWGIRLQADGHPLNFGFCRSFGEIFYAAGSGVFGLVYGKFGLHLITPVLICLMTVAVAAACMLPDPGHVESRQRVSGIGKVLLKNKLFLWLTVTIFFVYMGSNSLFTYYPLLLQEMGGGSGLYGIALCFMALCDVPMMMLSKWLFKRFDAAALLKCSFLFHGVRIFLVAISPNLVCAVLALGLQCLSLGLMIVALLEYLSRIIDTKILLSGQSIVYSVSNLGGMVGVFLAGYLTKGLGIRSMYLVAALFPLAGLLLFCMTFRIYRKSFYSEK